MIDNSASKRQFQIDHFLVLQQDKYAAEPQKRLIDDTRYYCLLFSHTEQGLGKAYLKFHCLILMETELLLIILNNTMLKA